MRRSRRRHAWTGLGTAALVAVEAVWWAASDEVWLEDGSRKSDTWNWVASMALANTALVLLTVTLCVGPWYSIRTGRRPPPHLPLRRTVGLWTAFVAAVHVPLALELHTPGWRLWHPFVTGRPNADDPFPIRTDAFAMAYWVGSVAAVILLVLALTSNGRSMRRFGLATWKRIQRGIYALGVLVVAHVLYVQSFEARANLPRRLLLIAVGVVLVSRIVAWQRTRGHAADEAGRTTTSPAPGSSMGRPGAEDPAVRPTR